MFTFLRRIAQNEVEINRLRESLNEETQRRIILEDYLDIEMFKGDKVRAHYRKRRKIVRPVGRPKKKKYKKLTFTPEVV